MATATITRPLRGSRVSTFYLVKNLPSLASLDSAFQLQEYISLLIRRDVHDVEAIVSLPTSSTGASGKEGEASGSGKEGEKNEVMVDEACWIYEQLRRLAQDLSHPLITTLQQECTRASCPEMKAGEWLYLCVAHGNDGAMEQCCAIDYILHTVDSATALLNSPRTFPSRLQIPATSHRHFSSLARRLGRIFAHAYFHHREAFEQAEAESSLYARFLALTSKFDLVPAEFLVIPSAQFAGEEHEADDVPRYSQGRDGGQGHGGGYSGGQPMLREEDHRQFERNHREQEQQLQQLQQQQHLQQNQQQRYAPDDNLSGAGSSPSGNSPGGSKGRLTRARTDTMVLNDAEANALTEEIGRRGESEQQQQLFPEPEPEHQPLKEPEQESQLAPQEKELQAEPQHEEQPETPLTARPILGGEEEEEQFEILLSPGEEVSVPVEVELEGKGKGKESKTAPVEDEIKAEAEVKEEKVVELVSEPEQQVELEAPTTAEEPVVEVQSVPEIEPVAEPTTEPTPEPVAGPVAESSAVESEPRPEPEFEFEGDVEEGPFEGIDDSMAEVELHLLERPSIEKSEVVHEDEASSPLPPQDVPESPTEEGIEDILPVPTETKAEAEVIPAAEEKSEEAPASSAESSAAPVAEGESTSSAHVEGASTPAIHAIPAATEAQSPPSAEPTPEANADVSLTPAATKEEPAAISESTTTKEPETKVEVAEELTLTEKAATSSEEEVAKSLTATEH